MQQPLCILIRRDGFIKTDYVVPEGMRHVVIHEMLDSPASCYEGDPRSASMYARYRQRRFSFICITNRGTRIYEED